jgi:uncharacterized OsmC-like protein
MFLQLCQEVKQKKGKKKEGLSPMELAPESGASCKCFKIREITGRTSWVVFRS